VADDVIATAAALTETAASPDATASAEKVSDPTVEPESVADTDDVEATDEALESSVRETVIKMWLSPTRLMSVVGVLAVATLVALCAWFGFSVYHNHQADQRRALFIQVARQGVVNLTTIDFEHADSDIHRIMDSATGTFHDDFSKRSGPFVEVVKQVKSKSTGTITQAGLESESADQAQVLIAVTVKTSIDGKPQSEPRDWRMRVDVQQVGNEAKISNVEFVS
jgi:Mce-associated membrane protein